MNIKLWIALLALTAAAAEPAAGGGQQGKTPNTLSLQADAKPPAATIADFRWMAGVWTGEGLGGRIDEVWSEPDAGAMVGYFRLVRDGKPVFYEILTLREHEGSVEMRLKHVNPDMTGWEEKNDFVTFRLVKQEPDAVYFSGLTFRRLGDDRMEGFLALRNRTTGVVSEEKMTFRRTSLPERR